MCLPWPKLVCPNIKLDENRNCMKESKFVLALGM